jgi:hypothetical protein
MNLAARFAIFALLHLLVAPLAESRPAISDEGEASSKLLPITPEIEEAVSRDLRGCKPQLGKVVAGINKNGVYTLEGDLFHNGRVHAVVDDHLGVIICEARNGRWKPISMLNVVAVWKYPNWDINTAGTRMPSATRPFWMLYLQGHPLLVIAETPAKQGPYYETILFDSTGRHAVASDISFSLAPLVEHHYLLSGDASRVKAEWEATYFSKIRNGKFVIVKSWEDSQPFHQPEGTDLEGSVECSVAKLNGTDYTIMQDYRKIAHPADVVIFEGDVGAGWSGIVDAWKDHPVFARMYFELRHPKKKDEPGDGGDATAYVFEKLMRLPRQLYPIRDEFNPPVGARSKGRIEARMRIKIVGSKRARQLLAPDF